MTRDSTVTKALSSSSVTCALVMAAVLRFWSIGFGLPHTLTRPDEEKIVQAVTGVAQGDLNPHLFLYPSLFIYVVAAVEKTVGLATPTMRYMFPRIVSAAAGTLTVAALYAAATTMLSQEAALASTFLLAVVFLHVRDSHFGTVDVMTTLLIVCALWIAGICASRGVTWKRAAGAGLVCGLATSTKYNAGLVLLPVLAAIALDGRRVSRSWPSTATLAATVLACALMAFVATTPYALLDRTAFMSDVIAQRDTATGVRHGSILDPVRQLTGERGWRHHLTFNLRYGVGLPLLVAGGIGAIWLAIARPAASLIVLSFPLAFYAAMGAGLLVYARYMVPIVPFLCLGAGFAVERGAAAIARAFGSPRASLLCAVMMTVLVAFPTAAKSVAFDRLVGRTDTRVLGALWIEDHFPQGATIYQTGMEYGHLQPGPRERYSPSGFNLHIKGFATAGASSYREPDLIVVLDSPLAVFNEVPEGLEPILAADYQPKVQFKAWPRSERPSPTLYDQQDAFYVPFTDMSLVTRPGPDVRIFERRSR